jgi:hypothetical protein
VGFSVDIVLGSLRSGYVHGAGRAADT